jgi:hypothetical protein
LLEVEICILNIIRRRWVSFFFNFILKKIKVKGNFYIFLIIGSAGTFQMKVRQLKAKGMMVVPVPWFEFTPLDRQSRLMYLDKQISLVNSNR